MSRIICGICKNSFDASDFRGVASVNESIKLTTPQKSHGNNPMEYTKHICCKCLASKLGCSAEEKKKSEITQ